MTLAYRLTQQKERRWRKEILSRLTAAAVQTACEAAVFKDDSLPVVYRVYKEIAHGYGAQGLFDTVSRFDAETQRQTVVDREAGQYLGHPTTALLDDGQTMIIVYPKGHGRGAVVMKKSYDGGKTWSKRT